jgi:large subunit ribosomal protein L31
MRKGIHPIYREVIFLDASANFAILTRSCVNTNQTMKWEDGKEYPLVTLDISSASHPFYTGKMKLLDTTGRVERFKRKYGDYKNKGDQNDEGRSKD